jgi:hypothetical protein
MFKRLLSLAVAVAGLAGCATTPPSYRAVTHPVTGAWLLPPGAGSGSEFGAGQPPAQWPYIDIPVAHSACHYARHPEQGLGSGGLQGEVVPTPAGTVLRIRSAGMFVEEAALRTAWRAWWKDAPTGWHECLAADRAALEERLVERRPLPFDKMLSLHYGFDDSTRSVVIHPGTRVCAADVPYRAAGGTARFSAAGETCATAMSDGHGGANFGPAASVLYKFSLLDVSKLRVHAIAGWAEIPALQGHLFLLHYPKKMPASPVATGVMDTDYPLLIAVDAAADRDVVSRALQCVQGDEQDLADFCGDKRFDMRRCGTPADSPLRKSRPYCFRFGERGVLTPQVTILLNGTPVDVPLGTTLGGALERLTPPDRGNERLRNTLTQALSAARLQRMFRGRPAAMDVTGAGPAALQLLLLPGDQIAW